VVTSHPFVRTRSTWLAYLLTGYFLYLQASLGPLMPLLRDELGVGYAAASLHFSAFALGVLVMGLLGDRLSGAFGRRFTVWGGGFGMAVGALLLAAGPVIAAATLTGTLLMGLCGSLLLMGLQAALSDEHGQGRSVAISESNVVASVCAVLAPVAVGAFERAGILGWRGALVLGVGVLGVLFLGFRRTSVPEARASTEDPASAPRATDRLPALFWGYCAVLFLASCVEWGVAFWGAAFLEGAVGFGAATAATLMSVFFVAAVLGRIVGSRLARRTSGAAILFGALLVTVVGFALFWLPPMVLPQVPGVAALSVAGLFVTGLGISNLYPFGVSTATGVVPERSDRAVARIALTLGSAVLLAPFALGAGADAFGIGGAYGLLAALLVGAVATTAVVNRRAALSGKRPS
jgi:fucose permease